MAPPNASLNAHVSLRYERSSIIHTTQFILSASDEELVLDCSSGPIPAEASGEHILPIHARHALPWSAAYRLRDSLQQIIAQHEQRRENAVPQTTSMNNPQRYAGLPRIESAHA